MFARQSVYPDDAITEDEETPRVAQKRLPRLAL